MNLIKSFHIILYLYLEQLLTGLCFAQVNSTGTPLLGGPCKGSEITSRQVGHCQCTSGKSTQCKNCGLSSDCPKEIGIHSHSQLEKCYMGCTDDNQECDSCFLWFVELCQCLQDGPGVCPQRQSTTAGAYWVLMSAGRLMTTTELMPGILNLPTEDPWEWGQQLWQRGAQALAINSVVTRSQEQIHMHICPVDSGAQEYLAFLDPTKYLAMTKIPGMPWLCRASTQTGQSITGVTADTRAQIANAQCADYLGTAVIVDSKDRTWACVTYDAVDATEHIFCKY